MRRLTGVPKYSKILLTCSDVFRRYRHLPPKILTGLDVFWRVLTCFDVFWRYIGERLKRLILLGVFTLDVFWRVLTCFGGTWRFVSEVHKVPCFRETEVHSDGFTPPGRKNNYPAPHKNSQWTKLWRSQWIEYLFGGHASQWDFDPKALDNELMLASPRFNENHMKEERRFFVG